MAVVCLVSFLAVVPTRLSFADEGESSAVAPVDYKQLYEEQKQRNDLLERRVGILEELVGAEPFVKKEEVTETTQGFIGGTEISGYVAGSYFYNFNNPDSRMNTGRGFDVRHDEFQINKALILFETPVEFNAFDWGAGYAVELIFGQDAEFTQSSGLDLGTQGDLLQAYVEVNVPIGNGLKVLLGKCSTELGYELNETEENYNWSGGNLWTFLVPFTHTGMRLTYPFTPEWEGALLINNGWDNVIDNNNAKSFIGRVRYTPNENDSYTFVAYGGPEQDDNTSNWRRGVNIVLDHAWTQMCRSAVQIDYGSEDDAIGDGGTSDWFGLGLWLVHEPSEKWNVVLRGDFVSDPDGARTSESPYLAPFPALPGQDLYSVTLTLNVKPIEQVRIAPELRWDHSSFDTAFDGHSDQVTIGLGAAYFY
jgi:hypothetical protein